MLIPDNYNEVNIGSERLREGGHKCVIKKVTETTSSTGRPMLVVAFDTTLDDDQPNYYMNRYKADTRDEKKWGGRMFIVTDGEYGVSNLKRFLTAVERSNDGFEVKAGQDLKVATLTGLRVGIVFRGEDYTRMDSTVGFAVRGWLFCSYDKAFDQPVPEQKRMKSTEATFQASNDGFFDVPADADEDEGLPFN